MNVFNIIFEKCNESFVNKSINLFLKKFNGSLCHKNKTLKSIWGF